MHCSTLLKNGGLGFPKLSNIIGLAQLRLGFTLRNQQEGSVISTISPFSHLDKFEDGVLKMLEVERPYNLITLKKKKEQLKEQVFKAWQDQSSQGKGVSYFANDPVANAVFYDDNIFKDNRFIDALRLRTNTAGVRIVLARSNKDMDKQCRQCQHPLETLGHVLGQCVAHARRRIFRHNRIVQILVKHFTLRGYQVVLEPTIQHNGVTLKPDLIVSRGDVRFVVDVTVRFEDLDMGTSAAQEKMDKYACLSSYFTDGKSFSVKPVVLGSRGALLKETKSFFRKVALSSFIQKRISLLALSSSIEILNCHLDY